MPRGTGWDPEEDSALCQAYIKESNAVAGTTYKSYFLRVWDSFRKQLPNSTRTQSAVEQRWKKIKSRTLKFTESVSKAKLLMENPSEEDVLHIATMIFNGKGSTAEDVHRALQNRTLVGKPFECIVAYKQLQGTSILDRNRTQDSFKYDDTEEGTHEDSVACHSVAEGTDVEDVRVPPLRAQDNFNHLRDDTERRPRERGRTARTLQGAIAGNNPCNTNLSDSNVEEETNGTNTNNNNNTNINSNNNNNNNNNNTTTTTTTNNNNNNKGNEEDNHLENNCSPKDLTSNDLGNLNDSSIVQKWNELEQLGRMRSAQQDTGPMSVKRLKIDEAKVKLDAIKLMLELNTGLTPGERDVATLAPPTIRKILAKILTDLSGDDEATQSISRGPSGLR